MAQTIFKTIFGRILGLDSGNNLVTRGRYIFFGDDTGPTPPGVFDLASGTQETDIISPDNSISVSFSGSEIVLGVGQQYANNINILPGIFSYAALPLASANPNKYAVTSDVGAVFSNGSVWQQLFNPTQATVAIASNPPLPTATLGVAYTFQLQATSGSPPYTFALISSFGSTNTYSVSSTGVLSVTPSVATLDTISVQVSDSAGAVNQKVLTLTTTGTQSPAATPTFSPVAGTYTSTQTVTISSATGGSTIHYTTDGSTPTSGSATYSTPLSVAASEVLQAIAIHTGNANSAVGSASYTISSAPTPTATPTFSPAAGAYSSAQNVTVTCSTPASTIYYTTDGTTPTTASTVYSTPISVTASATVQAIATATGFTTSGVGSAAYTITQPLTATPTFSPVAGAYAASVSVTISCGTAGAVIYYTTNGSTPTTFSSVYSGPVSVAISETLQAIALASGDSQSATASAVYTITPSTQGFYKFNPGNYMITPQYGIQNSASVSNNLTWLKRLVANPAVGFVCQWHWSDLDQGTTIDNTPAHAVAGTGNYAGFTTLIGNMFNLLQTYVPGAKFGFYDNRIYIWHAPAPSGSVAGGCSVPTYILKCGGSLTVPTTFGAASTTTYSLYKYPSPSNECGFLLYAYNSPSSGLYGFQTAAYNDPAVVNCLNNFHQALALYQLPTATPYSTSTTYALGALASSGGNIYCSIQGSNLNNAVTNASFWHLSSNTYAGQTLDQCPLVELLADSDETSATFYQGPFVAGNTTSANICNYQNYYTGYLGALAAKAAAFPHTAVLPSFSYVIAGATGGIQDAGTWTGYMAQAAATRGLVFSEADIHANQLTTHYGPTNAMSGYIGVNPDGGSQIFGSFSTNYIGKMGAYLQIEPEDYSNVDGIENAAAVNGLIATAVSLQATHVLWSVQDNAFNQTAWASYIQPTFTAATATTQILPLLLMSSPAGVTGTKNSSTQVTVNWSTVQVGVSFAVFRDGTQVGTSSGTSYVDTGIPAGSHTYTVAMTNANGNGPASSGIVVTLP